MADEDADGRRRNGELRLFICWSLFAVWLIPTLIGLFNPLPILGIFTLLLPIIVVIQGSILYGWSGIACYLVLGVAIGFGLEASSVANGSRLIFMMIPQPHTLWEIDLPCMNCNRYSRPPAFESVPLMLNPPNGCTPTRAPVHLRLR